MVKLSKKDMSALLSFKTKVSRVLSEDNPRLTLFGSKVRGGSKSSSDIDVLVVVERLTSRKRAIISDIATDIYLETDIDISPHIYPKKERGKLLSLQTPFMLSIKQEGLAV